MAIGRYGRETSALDAGQPGMCDSFLKYVESLFGDVWLRSNDAHRLQDLWQRKDHLATCELFALGRAISVLDKLHGDWLRTTSNKIKKQPINAHGFISEILVCASIRAPGGNVVPATGNRAGYDSEVKYSDGVNHVVSIKNHDITMHEATFQRHCKKLKNVFVAKVKEIRVHGGLRVVSNVYLDEGLFDALISFVGNELLEFGTYELGNAVAVVFCDVSDECSASSTYSSELVVVSPYHRNEMLNQEDKLMKAAKNLKKHMPRSTSYFRWVWMRLHASINGDALCVAARKMLALGIDAGFDGIIVCQPAVVRTQRLSVIHSSIVIIRDEAHWENTGFNEGKDLALELLVGGGGSEFSKLYMANGTSEPQAYPVNHYLYQDSDYYVKMKLDDSGGYSGEIRAPASGARFHLVYECEQGSFAFGSKLTPYHDELLIF